MRIMIIAVTLALLAPGLMSCDKYKLVDVEQEEADKAEAEKIAALEKQVKHLEKHAEAKPQTTTTKKETSTKSSDRPTGWVRLYEDAGFTKDSVTIKVGQSIGNFDYVRTASGNKGFNDKVSSVRYDVPDGWVAILHEDRNFGSRAYPLKGKGSVTNLGSFSDKASSLQWKKR